MYTTSPFLTRKVINSYLSAECCKADRMTPLYLGGSTKEQEDTESVSATCYRQPQRNNDQRGGSFEILLGSQDGRQQ